MPHSNGADGREPPGLTFAAPGRRSRGTHLHRQRGIEQLVHPTQMLRCVLTHFAVQQGSLDPVQGHR